VRPPGPPLAQPQAMLVWVRPWGLAQGYSWAPPLVQSLDPPQRGRCSGGTMLPTSNACMPRVTRCLVQRLLHRAMYHHHRTPHLPRVLYRPFHLRRLRPAEEGLVGLLIRPPGFSPVAFDRPLSRASRRPAEVSRTLPSADAVNERAGSFVSRGGKEVWNGLGRTSWQPSTQHLRRKPTMSSYITCITHG
jgi:hypothetical protein